MSVTLNQLLKAMVEQGGSDLHITTNSAPQIRVDGVLRAKQSDFKLTKAGNEVQEVNQVKQVANKDIKLLNAKSQNSVKKIDAKEEKTKQKEAEKLAKKQSSIGEKAGDIGNKAVGIAAAIGNSPEVAGLQKKLDSFKDGASSAEITALRNFIGSMESFVGKQLAEKHKLTSELNALSAKMKTMETQSNNQR